MPFSFTLNDKKMTYPVLRRPSIFTGIIPVENAEIIAKNPEIQKIFEGKDKLMKRYMYEITTQNKWEQCGISNNNNDVKKK
jgi:hypothetical protein